jgi:hypothetical protein
MCFFLSLFNHTFINGIVVPLAAHWASHPRGELHLVQALSVPCDGPGSSLPAAVQGLPAPETTRHLPGQSVETTRHLPGQSVETTRLLSGQSVETTRHLPGQSVETTRHLPSQSVETTRHQVSFNGPIFCGLVSRTQIHLSLGLKIYFR